MKYSFTIIIIFCAFISPLKSEWELQTNTQFVTSFFANKDYIYIGHNNGLTKYNLITKEEKFFSTHNSELQGCYVNSFLSLPDETILISSNKGLTVLENNEFNNNKSICIDYPDKDARMLYRDSSDNIWTYSANKVFKYSDDKWTTFDLGNKINYKFEIIRLVVFKKFILAEYSDNSIWNRLYYYPEFSLDNNKVRCAVIADTGIVRVFNSTDEFPDVKGDISIVSSNDNLILLNKNRIYKYTDKNFISNTWKITKELYPDSLNPPLAITNLLNDKNGNVWFTCQTSAPSQYFPVMYDIKSGKVIEFLKEDIDDYINYVINIENGDILAFSANNLFFKTETGWLKKSKIDCGIQNGIYFSKSVKLFNNEIYSFITSNLNSNTTPPYRGSIIRFDDSLLIAPLNMSFPYTSLTKVCINKQGKGLFEGKLKSQVMDPEYLKYETDMGFSQIDLTSQLKYATSYDGQVYFSGMRINNKLDCPYLTTWQGNNFKNIDMGFTEKEEPQVIDFDFYRDNLIALGQYFDTQVGDTFNYNSFLSFYNTTTKELVKYDKSNSAMPDFYEIDLGYYSELHDTIPMSVTVENNENVWISTSVSLMKFTPFGSMVFPLAKFGPKAFDIYADKILYDENSKEIICYKKYAKPQYEIDFDGIYYFDTQLEAWDNLEISKSGLIGNFIKMKKLLDNNVWASDDKGYLYQYVGKGKFKIFDLQINGRPNLNASINDFMIDANNYLQLGTDIGLLTNKTILPSDKVEDNRDYLYSFPPFPNPATKEVRSLIYWDMGSDIEHDEIGVYNIYGAKVSDRSKITFDKLSSYNGYLIWNCAGIETGVYLILIKHGTETRTIKVLVN